MVGGFVECLNGGLVGKIFELKVVHWDCCMVGGLVGS